jgi:hypothetical protein
MRGETTSRTYCAPEAANCRLRVWDPLDWEARTIVPGERDTA